MILIKGELKNNNSMFFTALTTDAASYNLHHDYRGSATREALGAVNDFTVGVFNTEEKKYYANRFRGAALPAVWFSPKELLFS